MHDRSGQALNVGDTVLLEGVITAAYPDAETCNLTVQFVVPQLDTPGRVDTCSVAARQTIRLPSPLTQGELNALADHNLAMQARGNGAGAEPSEAPPAVQSAAEASLATGCLCSALAVPHRHVSGAVVALDNPAPCNCPALPVTHRHEQGGPVAIEG